MTAGSIPKLPPPVLKTDAATAAAPVAAAGPAAAPTTPATPTPEIPAPKAKFTPPGIDAKNFGKDDDALRETLADIATFISRLYTALCCQPKQPGAHDEARSLLDKAAKKVPEKFRPDVREAITKLSDAIDNPPTEKGALTKQIADLVPVTVDDHAGATLRNIAKKLESALIA